MIRYNRKLKRFAQVNRKIGNLSEALLWLQLKNNKMKYDFHRQKPVGNYIVDFYCPELCLVIEIDGMSHNDKIERDLHREQYLYDSGMNLIRFDDRDIKKKIDSVLVIIKGTIRAIENGERVFKRYW